MVFPLNHHCVEDMAFPALPWHAFHHVFIAQDDVVICCAVRTPLCKAKRGSFKDPRSWGLQVQGFLSFGDGMGWVFYHQFMARKFRMGKVADFFFPWIFRWKVSPFRFVWDQLERVILQTNILHQLQENTWGGDLRLHCRAGWDGFFFFNRAPLASGCLVNRGTQILSSDPELVDHTEVVT